MKSDDTEKEQSPMAFPFAALWFLSSLYEAKGTLMIVFLQLLVKNLGATKEAVSSINIILIFG